MFLFSVLFRFIQNFQSIRDCLWIVNTKSSKVVRAVAVSTQNWPYDSHKNPQIGIFTSWFLELTRALSLDTAGGLTVLLTSTASTATDSALHIIFLNSFFGYSNTTQLSRISIPLPPRACSNPTTSFRITSRHFVFYIP